MLPAMTTKPTSSTKRKRIWKTKKKSRTAETQTKDEELAKAIASITPDAPPLPAVIYYIDAQEWATELFDRYVGTTIKDETPLQQQIRIGFLRRFVVDMVVKDTMYVAPNPLTPDRFLSSYNSALRVAGLLI